MFGRWQRTVLLLFGVAVLGLAGCSTTPRSNDPVSAYRYAKRKKKNAEKSFYWMHEAAVRKYPPAMKELSWYYMTGFGTEKDYRLAAEWIWRYTENSPSSEEGMKIARRILSDEIGPQTMDGLALLARMIQHEARLNHEDSAEVQEAVALLTQKMEELCTYWLKRSAPEKAFAVVEYCWKAAEEYPAPFPEDFFKTVERLMKEIRSGESSAEKEASKTEKKAAPKTPAAKGRKAKKGGSK